jgi:hypothetical protein
MKSIPKKQKNFRWFFLKEFTRQLVIASKPSHMLLPPIHELVKEHYLSPKKIISPQSPRIPNFPNPQFQRNLVPNELPALPIPKNQGVAIPFNPNASKVQVSSLQKLEPLLRDPSVLSVECPGPDKKVLVNRSGANQITQISLEKDEINQIITDISQKARIPIVPGVFKAALGNYIITAIISEFVGNRFVISKRNPYLDKQQVPRRR